MKKKTEENRRKYRDLKAETLREKGDTLRERETPYDCCGP
jgi:hypothetical protein